MSEAPIAQSARSTPDAQSEAPNHAQQRLTKKRLSHQDGYVTLASQRLHFVDYGGEGEPVVALHGLIQNAHAFDGIGLALVPSVRLLALDLRGRGASDWGPPDCYRWSYYLSDLRGFFDALGLSRFALLGTSMGGTLAMLYAMAHPLEVTRLVMNDTSLSTNRAGVVRAAQRIGRAPAEFANISEAVAWFLEERDGLDRLDEETRLAWVSHFLTLGTAGGLRFNCDPVIIRRAALIPPDLGPRVPWSHRWTVWEQGTRGPRSGGINAARRMMTGSQLNRRPPAVPRVRK